MIWIYAWLSDCCNLKVYCRCYYYNAVAHSSHDFHPPFIVMAHFFKINLKYYCPIFFSALQVTVFCLLTGTASTSSFNYADIALILGHGSTLLESWLQIWLFITFSYIPGSAVDQALFPRARSSMFPINDCAVMSFLLVLSSRPEPRCSCSHLRVPTLVLLDTCYPRLLCCHFIQSLQASG